MTDKPILNTMLKASIADKFAQGRSVVLYRILQKTYLQRLYTRQNAVLNMLQGLTSTSGMIDFNNLFSFTVINLTELNIPNASTITINTDLVSILNPLLILVSPGSSYTLNFTLDSVFQYVFILQV